MVCNRAKEKGLKSANPLAKPLGGTSQRCSQALATRLAEHSISVLYGVLKHVLELIWLSN